MKKKYIYIYEFETDKKFGFLFDLKSKIRQKLFIFQESRFFLQKFPT